MERRPEVDIGNHSFSHPYFSELSFEECTEQILSTEGIERRHKLFRFPYGDKGGEHKDRLQEFLKANGFENLALRIDHPWYGVEGLGRDRDIYWTFDCKDYKIYSPEHEFELADVWTRMAEVLQSGIGNKILLFHDNEVTAEKYPRYYEQLLHRTESMGLVFTQPFYQ